MIWAVRFISPTSEGALATLSQEAARGDGIPTTLHDLLVEQLQALPPEDLAGHAIEVSTSGRILNGVGGGTFTVGLRATPPPSTPSVNNDEA